MKYLFVVQGEGRGHYTQALSLKNMLENNGHEVVAVMVGTSAKRKLPDFFTQKIDAEIIQFQSPNFLPTPKGKSSSLVGSIIYNLLLLPVYFASLISIKRTLKVKQADVVINFYELLCGITYGLFNPETPMISIAHQYYFLTQAFHYSGNNNFQFRLLNFYSRLTAMNALKVLALSFRDENGLQYGNIYVVPPLLRKEVINKKTKTGEYIHGYLLNSGYAKELRNWSLNNPEQTLHFFWDKKGANKTTLLTRSLTMHTLSDCEFLNYMADSKAYATTAGFESVCEAMYMQKPILMIPTHIEQECNAIDAMCSNVGITENEFNIDTLLEFIPHYNKTLEFKFWAHTAESLFLNELTKIEFEPTNILATF